MAPLVADNPRLTDVVTLEPGEPIRHLARRLRALAPTHGLDLHGSVRSAGLRLLVHCRWSGYFKRKLARALLIATKLDAYRRRAPSPVAERYFEAARRLDTRPDGGPPEFCLGPGATDRAARAPAAVLERGLECRPCSSTGTAACPLGHHRCLTDITPEEVAATVERLVA